MGTIDESTQGQVLVLLAELFVPQLRCTLGEFGIVVVLAFLAKRVSQGTLSSSILAGLAGGVGIFLCYALAQILTDGLIPHKPYETAPDIVFCHQ